MNCGACCAMYRVSFYWAEANDAPGGWVPVEATEQLTPTLRCMRGTSSKTPRCEQLKGAIPGALCGIYENRPSVCRDLEAAWAHGRPNERCDRARDAWGLPPLSPGDWCGPESQPGTD